MESSKNNFFNQNKRIFSLLKCNFWSTDNKIIKSYNEQMQNCIDAINNSKDKIEMQKYLNLKETLKYSYNILTDQNVYINAYKQHHNHNCFFKLI